MKTIISIVLLCLALLFNPALASELTTSPGTPVSSPGSAINIALAYTGFYDNMDECKISPEDIQSITMQDSTTPFLGEYAHNRSVWRISFHDINLKSKDGEPADSQFNRDFCVYIDSLTGHLLKVTYFHDSSNADVCPEIHANEAERQLSSMQEHYIGFPADMPPTSFGEAITSGINPFNAKQILGQYVTYSWGNRTPRPVWIISLCGIPPITLHGPYSYDWIPPYKLNRKRAIIDAITGHLLSTCTIPSVPTKPEDVERILGE